MGKCRCSRPRGFIYTTIRELGPQIPYYRRNYGSQFPNGCICGPSGIHKGFYAVLRGLWQPSNIGQSYDCNRVLIGGGGVMGNWAAGLGRHYLRTPTKGQVCSPPTTMLRLLTLLELLQGVSG